MPSDGLLLLALDTSAAHCAAALLSGDQVLGTRSEPMQRGQAERLLPLSEELLAAAGAAWKDLDALGVCTGPGNFTGLRIGVAAVRGLALGLGVPAIGVTRFDALAAAHPGAVLVTLDGGRGGVLAQRFEDGVPRDAPFVGVPEALAAVPPEVLCIGHDAARIAARLGCAAGPESTATDPAAVARVAAVRACAPQPRPAPLYLRPPDAAPATTAPLALIDDA